MSLKIGKLALVGDVWYQILEVRYYNDQIEYWLHTKDHWTPHSWVKEIR